MNANPLTDDALQQRVESLSLRDFGKPFRHRASFNPRLRTTGGRYCLSDHRIEINPRYWLQMPEVVDGIIRHECCHYHLHLEGKGHRHRDRDFQELLAQVKGLRHAPELPGQRARLRWLLVCQGCGHKYLRQRRMNPARYRCGKCQGTLDLKKLD